MNIPPGTRLGPYQVDSLLGAGGMGEVYRAVDTRLNRSVAIKVLPADLAGDGLRRSRLEHEARTISSLSHPNICTLYDIGEDGGTLFLVMELLEGETLADRLARGALPTDEAFQIAIQIARGLSAAHRNGVVHRDLKPGNVMLTKAGRSGPAAIKLLDFGLAKPQQHDLSAATQTVTGSPLTAAGVVVGTVPYMAPEQLQGEAVDARTDLFALGCILFEMFSGQRAFSGTSAIAVAASILSYDPPSVSALRPDLPKVLEQIIRKCLAKDRDERWQSAADLADALGWMVAGDAATAGTAPAARTVRWRERLAWAVAAIAIAVAGTLASRVVSRPGGAPSAPARLAISLPPPLSLAGDNFPPLAISGTGTHIAFVGRRAGNTQLFIRAIDDFAIVAVPDSDGAEHPFFSPDGQWVGFAANGTLRRVPVTGGRPIVICKVSDNFPGAAWGIDGTIVFAGPMSNGLFRVPMAGGTPEALTTPGAAGEVGHSWPQFLPDGEHVLFSLDAHDERGRGIAVVSLNTRAWNVVHSTVAEASRPFYLPSGHIVYAEAGRLLRVPFDLSTRKVTGAPESVLEGIQQPTRWRSASFSIAGTGSLAYVPISTVPSEQRLVWTAGNQTPSPIGEEGQFRSPRLSPDSRWLTYSATSPEGPSHIWLLDLARNLRTRLTTSSHNIGPAWSPDGQTITFASTRLSRNLDIYQMPVDGSRPPVPLLVKDFNQYPVSWSPDGRALTYQEGHPQTGDDIWIYHLGGRTEAFLATPAQETAPQFSPDGRWILYKSDESGRDEISMRPYPGPGPRIQISRDGGVEPRWGRDGRTIYYRKGDAVMAAPVSAGTVPTIGTAIQALQGHYGVGSTGAPSYDVSADGSRFLMVQNLGLAGPTEIYIVLNWVQSLSKSAAPGGR